MHPNVHRSTIYSSQDVENILNVCWQMNWWRIISGNSAGKESVFNAGDLCLIPGSGRFPGEGIHYPVQCSWASLVMQMVKNLPAMQEIWVGKIPWRRVWTEEPSRLQSMESQRVRHDWGTNTFTFMNIYTLIDRVALVVRSLPANAGDIRDVGLIPGSGRAPGGGHSNPLQYSCLENPMDRGAWCAS